jgi:ComF family protein
MGDSRLNLARRAAGGARLAVRAALDLLWPPVCPSCGTGLDAGHGDRLCELCRAELPLISGRACRRCGMPLGPFEEDHGGRYCTDCGGKNLVFTRAASAGVYEGPMARLVQAYKYSPRARCAHLAGHLAGLLASRLSSPDCRLEASQTELIVPVPSHRSRRIQRGFDAAGELARGLAQRLDRPSSGRVLAKTRPTAPQMGLSRAERLTNVQDSFGVRRPAEVRGRLVLLVDDVMTTCATAAECARTLRAAGAREVRVASVARALEGRSLPDSGPGIE